jgi:hypothetical protein
VSHPGRKRIIIFGTMRMSNLPYSYVTAELSHIRRKWVRCKWDEIRELFVLFHFCNAVNDNVYHHLAGLVTTICNICLSSLSPNCHVLHSTHTHTHAQFDINYVQQFCDQCNSSRYLSALNKCQHHYGMKNCEDHFRKLCPVCFLCIFAHTGHHCRIMAQQRYTSTHSYPWH